MNTNKILLAGIAGGVIFFLLGWLIYGILLMNFMSANAGAAATLQKEPMEMWALVLGNFAWGFLYAIVLGRWTTTLTFGQGACRGAIIAFLAAAFMDLVMYATMNFSTLTCTAVDIVAMTVIGAIGGGFISYLLNMNKKS